MKGCSLWYLRDFRLSVSSSAVRLGLWRTKPVLFGWKLEGKTGTWVSEELARSIHDRSIRPVLPKLLATRSLTFYLLGKELGRGSSGIDASDIRMDGPYARQPYGASGGSALRRPRPPA